MLTLDIPERYLGVAPIIVTSPTTRCGTTLLQRLLSASDNAFVYGEEVGNHFVTLTMWLGAVFGQLSKDGPVRDAAFQAALAGKLDDWSPNVSVPTAVMMRAWMDVYFQMPIALAEHGRSVGRPLWGFKWPAYPRDTIKALLNMMPRARVVYVYRDPFDALMSAKARRFVQSEEEIAQFSAEWAKNMRECSALKPDSRVLFLEYETFARDKEAGLRRLEAFTGARNIKRAIFDAKVNTFRGEVRDGRSPSQYIQPAPLTQAERAAVVSRAGPVMAEYYPAA
jgi:hypothetical protein